ncbi:hypothetical protein U9M48_004458 [Paspalum notatum var. saurae]|uniref:O-methyltransferase n=1 Tax=Paspalum notatum var. saurae TaxID=547442 RepID=A0AAQ3PMP6_PASNO
MAAASRTTTIVPTDAELLQAQADLWRHSLYYLTSMALKCAVELRIPTAIHNLGGAASLQDLVNALSLPKTKLPFLGRLIRLLVTSGIFMSGGEETYRLKSLSWLLVEGLEAEDHGHQKYFVIATNTRNIVEAALSLADWFKKDLATPLPSPFEVLHGVPLFHDDTPKLGEDFDIMINKSLVAHDNFAIGTTIRECDGLFQGLQSLTDCGGGDGTMARAIVKAFPGIKCTVLDLPKVIEKAPADDDANYVTGDMSSPSHQLKLCCSRGRQWAENDWREIFMKAGFSDYKIVKKIGVRAFIEVYP